MILLRSEKVELPSADFEAVFSKLIAIWKERCYTVNRRLSGIKLVEAGTEEYVSLLAAANIPEASNVEVRRFIPRAKSFSELAYEISAPSGDLSVNFTPRTLDAQRNPQIDFPYRISIVAVSPSEATLCELQIHAQVAGSESAWLSTVVFQNLLRWLKNLDLGKLNVGAHHLVGVDKFSRTYQRIKEGWGRSIAAGWKERTDPQKFVYEDCAIAAYLLELWRRRNIFPQKFCDVGCGNGLLVHLLCEQQVSGYGIDIRRRKLWLDFNKTDLREQTLNPEEDVLDADFLIGNHSDELTPWIPILAARARCNFFLLPCCPFDFYGRYQKQRKSSDGGGYFASYLCYIRDICIRLGYTVEEDRMKIPSTKRHCFVCFVPQNGLPSNVDEIIVEMLALKGQKTFVAREKHEKVRNCSHLPAEIRRNLTEKIFNYLLSLVREESASKWQKGGQCELSEVVELLTPEEKIFLKDSDGGIQTFIKNQHQVFKVQGGRVLIRDWSTEGFRRVEGRVKTSECWFHRNHPQGCPLSDDVCSYRHI